MSGARITAEQLAAMLANGMTVASDSGPVRAPVPAAPDPAPINPAAKRRSKQKGATVADAFVAPPDGSPGPLTFTVGVQTASEANESHWQAKSHRSGIIRKRVCRLLGANLRHLVPFAEAFHSGLPVRVHFVRLGGGKLDKLANLGTALKAAEDAVCLVLGADDGAANWLPTCDQIPGGPYGVRITLSLG